MGVMLPSRMLVSKIQATVAEAYGISLQHMTSPARHQSVAWPRQVAMYLAREKTHHSLPGIGRLFNRDHTTVLHAIRAVERKAQAHPILRADVEALREALGG